MKTTALHILKTISEIIASDNNFDNVLSEIVHILAHNLNTDVCSVYIYDEKSDELVLAATCGLNKKLIGKIRLKSGQGITGTAFIRNELINVKSAGEHAYFQYFKGLGEEKYKSFLSAPLIIGSKRVGVLNLQRVIEEKFSDEIIDIVKSLAPQIANFIFSSRMLSVLSASGKIKKEKKEKKEIMLKGISVSQGIAIGKASIYSPASVFDNIDMEKAAPVKEETDIFLMAVKKAKEETVALEEKAVSMISEADASIFYVHLVFLEDKALIDAIKKYIKEGCTAEYAVKKVYNIYKGKFKDIDNDIFREKAADLKDVMLRLVNNIRILKSSVEAKGLLTSDKLDIPDKSKKQKAASSKKKRVSVKYKNEFLTNEPVIVVARELLPSEIFRLTAGNIAGIITERGGAVSHLAILAKALHIPALLGVKNLFAYVKDGKQIILDSNTGACYINPNKSLIKKYRDILSAQDMRQTHIDTAPAKTKDGHNVTIRANISLISEMPLIKQYGAKGIGLYRTEFLYMIRDYLPSEDAQFKVFSTIVNNSDKEEIAFRLLDIGADKPLSYLSFTEENNPALGERGIRLLLKRENILRPHIRAILRAGASGNIKLICPMISDIKEVIDLKNIIEEVKKDLDKEGIVYAKKIKIGIMLEVPSAFLQLEVIIRHVDFVSIGTNDLFQYTFASDRENNNSFGIPQYFKPVFISMIAGAADIVNNYPNKEISVCGEMAADPYAAPLFIGSGIYDLSMHPTKIPAVKRMLARFTKRQCKKILDKALSCRSAEEVYQLIRSYIT